MSDAGCCEHYMLVAEELDARIAELERRVALLTATVNGYREWRASSIWDSGGAMKAAFTIDDALTDAGFPWTDGDR